MAHLFKSQFISIIILGLGLEAAKFTATVGLHNLWGNLNKFLKIYLFAGVVALSIITSLGIYGFLSSAYTVSKAEYSIDEGKIIAAGLDVIENENINSYTEEELKHFLNLANRENVWITPHIAGYSKEALEKMAKVLIFKLDEAKIG
jgi:hypothetical protein